MWSKLSISLLLVCGLLFQETKAQEVFEVQLNCTFQIYQVFEFSGYTCLLSEIDFDFSNPFYYITITGEHEANRTNEDVTQVSIQLSTLNAIPANIFQVFQNLEVIESIRSGITAITPANFSFSRRLRGLFLNYNQIPTLSGSPFFTQSGITTLSLYSNEIETIGNGFFLGLSGLRYLSIAGNNLRTLTPQLMAPLVNLGSLLASNNQIETLSGRVFSTNRNIEVIGLEYNQISAVGPKIFDDLPRLEFVGLSNNLCIDGFFDINEENTIETIYEELQQCFDNSIPEPPRSRQVMFELRGNMTLFNEYREVILSVQGRNW